MDPAICFLSPAKPSPPAPSSPCGVRHSLCCWCYQNAGWRSLSFLDPDQHQRNQDGAGTGGHGSRGWQGSCRQSATQKESREHGGASILETSLTPELTAVPVPGTMPVPAPAFAVPPHDHDKGLSVPEAGSESSMRSAISQARSGRHCIVLTGALSYCIFPCAIAPTTNQAAGQASGRSLLDHRERSDCESFHT